MRAYLRRWGWLWAALLLALLLRLPDMATVGHEYDLQLLWRWGYDARVNGLFGVYSRVPSVNYPPVLVSLLALASTLEQLGASPYAPLKIPPITAELLMIAAVGGWLRQENGRWRLAIVLLLAFNPGLIGTSALWGQGEALQTLFLLLALLALNHDQPRLAWGCFALGLLTKFQAVALLPLLVLLTLRRYGWRELLLGTALCGALLTLALWPFVAASGWEAALRHYLTAFNPAPTTANAFNIWYWITPPPPGIFLTIPHYNTRDSDLFWQNITYRQFGLGLLSLYTLLICAAMWRGYRQKREFLWAAALYLGFFMLSTRIHERYLYPALVFAIVGMAQLRWLWIPALGLTLTYAYNIVHTLDVAMIWLALPLPWLLPQELLQAMLALNLFLLVGLAFLLFVPDAQPTQA
ncbi:MAG: hypothetical protein HXY40_13785 [Chloroflexi bacterium]|nr:hypothetical protein [Chloroflexota bacterium]